jgi:hypothetical protein
MDPLYYCMRLIDSTGRHYLFNIELEPITVYVNKEQYVWNGRDNNLQDKFQDMYEKLMVGKQSLCVITRENCIMLHADQITGIQLRREPGY